MCSTAGWFNGTALSHPVERCIIHLAKRVWIGWLPIFLRILLSGIRLPKSPCVASPSYQITPPPLFQDSFANRCYNGSCWNVTELQLYDRHGGGNITRPPETSHVEWHGNLLLSQL
jgi:hypothetical protein